MGGLVYGEELYGHPLVIQPQVRGKPLVGQDEDEDMEDGPLYTGSAALDVSFDRTQG